MTETSDYGTVTSLKTGEAIRPATAAEWRRTAEAVNAADTSRPDGYTGAWWSDDDGRAVWVDGGPRVEVTEDDVQALLAEAFSARDSEKCWLCELALADDGTEQSIEAFAGCVREILDNRAGTA